MNAAQVTNYILVKDIVSVLEIIARKSVKRSGEDQVPAREVRPGNDPEGTSRPLESAEKK